jgi:uncharacterized protein
MRLSRRRLLQSSSAVALGFAGLRALTARGPAYADEANPAAATQPAAPRRAEKLELFDLPPGFSYRVVSQFGERMADGLRTPGLADGMAAFPGPDGKTILVRNHEISSDQKKAGPFGDENQLVRFFDRKKLYDPGEDKRLPNLGGTTTILYDTKLGRTETVFLSLAGTCRNCAGGPTPWGSWITCEETVQLPDEEYAMEHGYNFEVPATLTGAPFDPVPLRAMGRFNHEAVAVDPKTGIVYQTEDRPDSLLYRFLPTTPGKLVEGGRLQALRVLGQKALDTRNWKKTTVTPGTTLDVEWVDMEDIESPDDDLRYQGYHVKRCARFARGEGMWHGKDGVYFAATTGGRRKRGQIWRYVPGPHEGTSDEASSPGKLELFVEPNDHNLCENADNLTVAPWGDLFLCEDNALKKNTPEQNILRVTPDGKVSKFARNALNRSELAGVTFSPDGSTLFVNIYNPGVTVAITGPWQAGT